MRKVPKLSDSTYNIKSTHSLLKGYPPNSLKFLFNGTVTPPSYVGCLQENQGKKFNKHSKIKIKY